MINDTEKYEEDEKKPWARKRNDFVIHRMSIRNDRQCTWVPSCVNMCAVSCHRPQLIDCFSVQAQSDLFYSFLLAFFDMMFIDNFSLATFIDTTGHVMRTYMHRSLYTRQSCLLSIVETIIINDHGSLVVCC